jgi:hypothetical protein
MRPLGPDCTIRTRFHEPLLVPNEKRLVHGGWDCAEVYSRFNNASAGANKDYGLPTTRFLAHTFHGLTIQISDKINLPYSLYAHHSIAACATYAQYSLTANTTSNAYVLQLVSLAMMGSIGLGGILNTAYRLCKVLLGQHTHLAERLCQATTLLVPFRTRGYFWPCIPIPAGGRSLESSACLRD